ncbi:lysozyme inhibitor LprI family protein [Martelella sp. HB161492]|uniref:lysozyme inhibitor LprI family protein n=1 Tax=Martelella sp. HB161492 TaxID=2720726 RepID=UPI00158FBD55|nr:lysozyme inhibitor LprI family protein [Martelella sp. HB161492]
MRFGILLLVLALFQVPSAAGAQPSFNCKQATTPTEIAICRSQVLSALDQQIAEAYAKARSGKSEQTRNRIRSEQMNWLGMRDQCGADSACLDITMSQRARQLSAAPASATARGKLTGSYCANGFSDKILIEDYGNALDFSISSFQRGFSCGTGRIHAVRNGNAFTAKESGCSFRIVVSGGSLVFTAGGEPACADFCGARARFGERSFNLNAKHPLEADWMTAEESGGC